MNRQKKHWTVLVMPVIAILLGCTTLFTTSLTPGLASGGTDNHTESLIEQPAFPTPAISSTTPHTHSPTTLATMPDDQVLATLGREVAVPRHLQDGEEYTLPLTELLQHGQQLFQANWTVQEGAGRPFSTGTGMPLADHASPLLFPRNFNRISGPDANSCAGCHNMPFGTPGGGGDIVANVFVLGQRFDFVTFDQGDIMPNKGTRDEASFPVTLQNVGNNRATVGMYGSGFVEMLARQITADLQAIRNEMQPGDERILTSKGINFGKLKRNKDGTWNTKNVEGLPAGSLASPAPNQPPSLAIQPFHQAGAVISLRQFSNNAFNHHHGIQSAERFGQDRDEDGDSFVNELTRADITAVTLFQATMAVPGRVIPRHPILEAAIRMGEQTFEAIGCAGCHIPKLPLDREGWIFVEPNPYNPKKNLQYGEAPELHVDLLSTELPQPRLEVEGGIVYIPVFTDFKLHDITNGMYDPNIEPLNMHGKMGSTTFFAGNRYFLTRRLWGVANEPPYFHHGLYTTLHEAVLAHNGEALAARTAFEALPDYEQKCVIEFLKSLQILPPGTRSLVIDELGNARQWPD